MNNFAIKTKITQDQYCKLFLRLSYRQRLYQIITIMGIMLLLLSTIRFFTKSAISEREQLLLLAFSIYCLLLFPIIVWVRAKKIYKTNQGLQSEMIYEFSENGLRLNSAGIETTFEWKDFGKVDQTQQYFLLFGYNRAAYFIQLKDITKEQINFIKQKMHNKNTIV